MNEEIIRQKMAQKILSLDEIKDILNYIVSHVRENLDINDSHTRLCQQSCMKTSDICNRLNIPYIMFDMKSLSMGELQHYYGITGFQTEFGQICFLLDTTYIQFTEKDYPVNVSGETKVKYVTAPGNFMTPENKDRLVENGYLTITEDSYNDYLRSFIETYKLVNKVNESQVYESAYNDLFQCNINFASKDYLNNQGITY